MDSSSWPAPGAERQEAERLAGEQAALHRVATLVAEAAAPEIIFAAVAEELAQLWGVVITAATRPERLRLEDEHRISAFAELVGTAIASAHARVELRAIAEEQAALRRVAMLVAEGAAPGRVFAAVAEEAGRVLPEADFAMVARYDAEGGVEVVGGWSRAGGHRLLGRRSELGGRNVSTAVFETGQAARVDYLADGDAVSTAAREIGMRSSAGAPISVEGRLWGVMIATSVRENALPSGAERRLAAFTELIATTIANAQARQELSAIAEEQAALRRVATLVAHGDPPRVIFEAVAQEVGRLLPADFTLIGRFEDGRSTGVAGWSSAGEPVPVREQVSLSGQSVTGTVFLTGRPARMDSYADASGGPADYARDQGIRSSVGAPIIVEGRLWGVIIAAATNQQPLPPETEERLAGFTELLATALANAEARQELRRVAVEQAALRRVATLVAQGASSSVLFHAVVEETGLLLSADATVLMRYDADGSLTRVGRWSRPGIDLPPGERSPLGGRNVTTIVFETGQAARLDNYGDDAGDAAVWVAAGLRSSVGVPISVEGRLWGVEVALSMSEQPLPADADARLAGFTELVATAIANADAQAELTASRARIVATADETRRRIERDLHDGAQQRLVTLGLQLRSVQADLPPELGKLRTSLDSVAAGLTSALDELREYARGIHPAILTQGGLEAALRALARRSLVPVTLDVQTRGRLPERLELTTYYVISEALANAAKHADASAVHIGIEQTGEVIRLSISDDGTGGADPLHGSGLVGLKDRVAAVGGTLHVQSRPGEGTTLLAELPSTV
jgi:signal transduction histidine kinase